MRRFGSVSLILFFCVPITVYADIDRSNFPANLRALEWREVGPYRGGRSAAVAGIAADRETYYFGSTGGGVWKTKNSGQSWQNVSDGFFGGSIGAVAVSEWDPNVVYVGGGEKTVRGNVSPGDGMWKSTDAGDTWSRIGLTDSQHISRLRIHPKNPDLVYAAVMGHLFGPNDERGVYRSVDGGTTWQRVLFVSDEVGAVDLAMDPTNPRILYASFWRILRTPYSLESGGEGSGIYKSVDGGDTWEELTRNDGLPLGAIGISGIAVSPTNNKNVYAIIEAENGGVFRSRDGGKTWSKVNEDRNLRQRAWYYTRIYADPADEESLYVLNVDFHYSKDGGKSFSTIDVPHGDNHDLWIDPGDPLRMIQSNDGGANVSFDRGQTWSVQSNQPTAQMYRVSTDNDFPYRLLGGQQDNSAVRIRSRSAVGDSIGVRDWEPTAGGESGHIVAKPDNPDIVVGGSYGGYLRVINHRTGETRSIDVWPDNPMGWGAAELKYRFQWNFPIAFSVHDPDVLYVAANVLFRTDDMGQTWDTISPDLTRNDKTKMGSSGGPITKDNTSIEYYGTIFAIAESHHERGVFWTGSDDGRIHVTRNGGDSWQDVTPSGLPEWAQINSVDIHPFERGGAYIAATRYKSDDFRPYLYRTLDWGRTWQRIDEGIPGDEFTRVVRADPDRRGLLYAGTEKAIYYSLDDGNSWKSLQLNLPLSPITDLSIKNRDLIAATQGRGYWILDDLSVLHQADSTTERAMLHLYEPRPAYRLTAGDRADEPNNAGTNPPIGVVIHYSLGEDLAPETEISLKVFEARGTEPIWIWTRKPPPSEEEESERDPDDPPETRLLESLQGLNRFVWDLRYPGMERFDKLIMWADMREGPRAVPGTYLAELTVGDVTRNVNFDVLADPRSSSSAADYRAQFDFVMSSRELLSTTHAEIRKVRQLRSQLEALMIRLEKEAPDSRVTELLTEIGALIDTINPIEEALYQTQNESRQDPLNYPIRLNNKLTSLMKTVDVGDARPTVGAIAVRDELGKAIQSELAQLEAVWTEHVPALNSEIQSMGIDLVSISEE
ncbi:MAG: glycosyl hydrolase [Proteobacteria bacterium]|nr:glycosyl hydrolase [Pseudomonadota bacterium]